MRYGAVPVRGTNLISYWKQLTEAGDVAATGIDVARGARVIDLDDLTREHRLAGSTQKHGAIDSDQDT